MSAMNVSKKSFFYTMVPIISCETFAKSSCTVLVLLLPLLRGLHDLLENVHWLLSSSHYCKEGSYLYCILCHVLFCHGWHRLLPRHIATMHASVILLVRHILPASHCLSRATKLICASFSRERVGEFYDMPITGTCVSPEVIIGLAALYSAFSVLSDFTFAILPAFLLWDLKIDRRTKFTIIPILAMGCVASSAVVARFPYLPRFRNFDFLFATVDIAIWSCVEQGLAIAAGCLATLRPLLKEVSYRLGWTKPSTGASGAHTSGMMQSGTFPNTNGHRSRNLDMYDLSEFEQLDDEESKIGSKTTTTKKDREGRFSIRSLGSPKLPSPPSERKGGVVNAKVSEDSEGELSDQQSKNVVVSKDFLDSR